MKRHNGLSILCSVLLFGAVLVSSAFADRKAIADNKKVDETELAEVKASLTGASVINQTADIDKDVRDQERLQTNENLNKDVDVSPSVSMKSKTVDQNISDHTTPNFRFTGMNVKLMGVTNSIKSR
jgi:hypothetical protein